MRPKEVEAQEEPRSTDDVEIEEIVRNNIKETPIESKSVEKEDDAKDIAEEGEKRVRYMPKKAELL